MKVKFDYNNVPSQTVANVLDKLKEELKDFKIRDEEGNEIGVLEFGSINLYLTIRSSIDNSPLGITTSNGKDLEWTVKPHKMSRTKKEELYSTDDFVIYKN